MRSPAVLLALSPLIALGAASCQDNRKASEQGAADEVGKLAALVKEDVAQVRKGLPLGATKLGAVLEADPGADLAGLQRAIVGARNQVPDLSVAKSTFFSFADPSGLVLRSEADPDMLANKSVVAAFPVLEKALDPASPPVEVFGEMAEMRGVRVGPDFTWVVAAPVKDPGGKLKGLFVTGWSFRRYAYFLEEAAKRDQRDRAEKEEKKSVPILYAFAVKGRKAYGAPLCPDVDAQAIEGLDVVAKTASGPYRGTVDVTGRTFGVAAERTPDLADDAAVAVMMSEL
jgi:hypothetical protein